MAVIQLENYSGYLQVEVRPEKLWASHERASYVVSLEQDGIPIFTAEHFRSGFSEHGAIRKIAMRISDACTYRTWNVFFRCSLFALGLVDLEGKQIQCRFYLLHKDPGPSDSIEGFWGIPGNCLPEALYKFANELYAEANEAHRIDDQFFVDNIKRPKRSRASLTARFLRIRQILNDHWDPIKIGHLEGAPVDEYDSYIPKILSFLDTPNAAEAIAKFLGQVERDKMAMSPNPQRAQMVGQMCVAT